MARIVTVAQLCPAEAITDAVTGRAEVRIRYSASVGKMIIEDDLLVMGAEVEGHPPPVKGKRRRSSIWRIE